MAPSISDRCDREVPTGMKREESGARGHGAVVGAHVALPLKHVHD
jgi:hypothetical protein